jgi:hypothetical protein
MEDMAGNIREGASLDWLACVHCSFIYRLDWQLKRCCSRFALVWYWPLNVRAKQGLKE